MVCTSPNIMPVGREQLAANRKDALRHWDDQSVPVDLIATQIDEYDELVELFIAPDSSAMRQEFAYGRLLGVRGQLCRLCPVGATELLPRDSLKKWHRAESLFRDHLETHARNPAVQEVINRVEDSWITSAEVYLEMLVSQIQHAEVQRQLGLLKSIDTVAMHLAQREVFRMSNSVTIPLSNAHAVKLRMRLLALYLMLHSSYFETIFPVIQSYRETFRITDPSAYPWWFVDRRLTERQLAWTYRRLDKSELAWRF
jgi:hypothetical protein